MKPDHGASSGLMPTRGMAYSIVPVLIRVPALPSAPRRPGRFAPTRRRRRLRREVRAVGSAVLVGLSATLGLLPIWGLRSLASSTSAGPALASTSLSIPTPADREPVVSLCPTLEPASTPSLGDQGASVVLHGFIVPDDRGEEAPHARD